MWRRLLCCQYSMLVLMACLYVLGVARTLLIGRLPRPLDPGQRIQEEASTSNASLPPEETPPQIRHPYYLPECYAYEGLRARFTCSDDIHSFRNYSYDDILECASDLWEVIRNRSIPNPWKTPGSSSSVPSPSAPDALAASQRPSVHLVMAGDSHIRNIFEVFLRRMANPRVKYRTARMEENDWRDSEDLFASWKWNTHEFFHELLHLDVPLRITFYWDPFLETLPQLLSSWTAGNDSNPTYLLIGSTLHYMEKTKTIFLTKGPEDASRSFVNHLKVISPQLAAFSKTTPVVFKLQDHLQKHHRNQIETRQNIDRYNNIARDVLPKSASSFVVWSSTVPLSDLYLEVCRREGSVLPHNFDWRCYDEKHLGYIVIDQYLDMYLNDICCCFKRGRRYAVE
ncbi:uncharacterized protein LOC135203895 [Macrobrachium nipponense]|uniref:uncharacterized protein LOC135203895 n=1 Tax=Macrobrachium nipponense TaxID=159736 RepID=UPI0030C897F1